MQWRRPPFTIQAGVNNLTNQRPPTLIDGATNTNTQTYDVIGRAFHLTVSAKLL